MTDEEVLTMVKKLVRDGWDWISALNRILFDDKDLLYPTREEQLEGYMRIKEAIEKERSTDLELVTRALVGMYTRALPEEGFSDPGSWGLKVKVVLKE